MTFHFFKSAILVATFVIRTLALGLTDSYSDADPAQSGYLSNHNMDPAVVDSAQFGQLWKMAFNTQEQFYAKPLTYTPSTGGPQLLFLASSQNNIRTLNAKTGDLLNTRAVHLPFLQPEIGCTDIPNYIGIIGTPVIDPNTDTVYFFSKTYIPNYRIQGQTGVLNGVYYFHGVNINTLQDVPGYPILIDGSQSDNAPAKYFIGGLILQRPSLVQIGSVVYGGFGGHCDLFNYTGLVIGVDVNLQKVVTNFATEAGPLAPQTNVWNQNAGGGQGGIWMSGMALASDGNRLFWVSGNGDGHENQGTPASGSSGCKTLGEAAVNLGVGGGGQLSLTDYFQPYDYQNMDGGDQDFGSGGIALLDPTVFQGTGVSKIAVTSGKNGKIYILNANNMGGYRLGPGQTDGIIQTLVTNRAVFGGVGSYPLEGGYIYSTPVGYPTYAYKLGFSVSGVPVFSLVGQTHESSAGRVGVGIPTVTSYKGREGTGILWMCDPDAGLRAWYAVPGSDGFLKTINLPQVNGLNKFQRPAFGDSRLYVTDANGVLYCLGSPVNLPLTCSSPVSFGQVALGSSGSQTVTCKANIGITSINGVNVGDAHFQPDTSQLPKGAIAAGTTFKIPVIWDLTNTVVTNAQNASYGNTSPGVKSTALTILTTNAVPGYSNQFPISLTGTEVSQKAFLSLTPLTVDYSGLVLLPNQTSPTVTLPIVISNAGLSPMTIEGYAWTRDDSQDPNAVYTNVTVSSGTEVLGPGFTSPNLPPVGTIIQPGNAISVDTTFTPISGVGSYSSFLNVWTDGGHALTVLEGSASTAPIANFSISTSEGGWLPDSNIIMDFGTVAPGSTSQRKIRICNNGGSVLTVSKSKPPNGAFHPDDPTELHESQSIPVGSCAYGNVLFVTNTLAPNVPDQLVTNTWTLNTDDLNFGVHIVDIRGTVHDKTVGPTNSTNNAVYTYLGCFSDTAPAGRLLPNQPYVGGQNENGLCQKDCLAGKYIFSGTEYQTECYCGNAPPPSQYAADPTMCTFACAGDGSQQCGGLGGYISIYYDATRYTPGSTTSSGGTTSGGPITVNQTGNYNYIGCYSEATAGRALSDLVPPVPVGGSTIETCEVSCQGYTYFGIEYSNECYCGNNINAGSVVQTSSDPNINGCSMLCGGNSSEYCGGPNRLDMYRINGTAPVPTSTTPSTPTPTATGGPTVVPSAGSFISIGCYTEATNGRALSGLANPVPGNSLTVEACASACGAYSIFGVEYGGECYCGNSFNAGAVVATGGIDPNSNGCSMTCSGNVTEYCGGPNRLNAYQRNSTVVVGPKTNNTSSSTSSSSAAPTPTGPVTVQTVTGWTYFGCYSEATNGRALSGLLNPIPGNTVTVESCAVACTKYAFFGVEYSGECFCGNTIGAGSALVAGSTPDITQCNMPCAANSTEYCGGPNRLNMYASNGTPSTSTSTSVSSTSSSGITINGTTSSTTLSGTSASPLPTGPITVQTLSGWTYFGCYSEATNGRALSGLQNPIPANTVTVESCASACSSYAYFGVEYSGECFCGNNLAAGSALVVGSTPATTQCNMACSGNSTEYCGGPNRLNMYASNGTRSSATSATTSSQGILLANIASPTPTGPSVVQSVGNYAFQGCYSEATNSRALAGAAFASNTMTVEMCATDCAGYTWFGVEYGTECYCGSSPAAGSVKVPNQADCNFQCPGNSSEYCGAGNRLDMYLFNANASSSVTSSSTVSVSISSVSTTSSGMLTTLASSSTKSANLSTANSATMTSPSASSSSSSMSSQTSQASNSTVSNSATKTSSSVIFSPTPSQTFGAWTYLGCANETSPRALVGANSINSKNMTVENCQAFCTGSNNNYGIAGLENSGDCWCGNALQQNSTVGFTGCNSPCTGNSSEICGGQNRLSVYNLTASIPPTTVRAVGSYALSGCYNDTANQRALSGPTYTSLTNNTVESCVSFCQANGQAYAGVEYGEKCFCGNSISTTAGKTDMSACNMPCTGNNREFCGASLLLTLYHNDPTSVNSGVPSSINQLNPATVKANTTTPVAGLSRRDTRFNLRFLR